MSKYWLAAVAVPVVSLVLLSSGVASASAEGEVNLIAAYGTVQNSDGLMGLVGTPGTAFNYTGLAVDESVEAAAANCDESWDSQQILCDPAPTTNVSSVLTQSSIDTGYTAGPSDPGDVGFVVIDLGETRTFGSLEVFQMHQSDGQVTDVELFVSSASSDVWPLQTDASWTSVTGGTVNDGPDQTGTGPFTNTAVTAFAFAATSGRYVMLQFENDGSYIADDYIEVAGVKLFSAVPVPAVVPAPEPVLADTGLDVAPAGLVALFAMLVGAAVLVASRRRSAQD